jgi:hypothetical protein
MYERYHHQLLSSRVFLIRLSRHALYAAVLMVVSLAIGMVGYGHYEHLEWRDAFLNTAMLLGGMGPVDAPKTPDGKLFAGIYALYAGLVFLATATVLLAPVVHRILHRFHCDERDT